MLKIEPTLVAVAERLSISKQTLDSRLSASDVKTGFIEQLALIYNRPISFFFDENSTEVKENAKRVKRNVNVDINGRIREILSKIFNNNAKAMAKATYVSQYTLNSIAREEATPDYDIIRRILEMSSPQISVDWLITGNGEMIENPRETTNNTENSIEVTDNTKSFNSNADEVIKDLTAIIKIQEERIAKLTDKLLDL